MAATSTPALEQLRRAGVAHRILAYELPRHSGRETRDPPSYGLDAAAALGVPSDRVFRTLIAWVDDALVVAVAPVAGRVDLKALASVLGRRRATLAEPAAAERASGSVIGGISPLGLRRPLPTVVDASAATHDTILISAGRRGLQVELASRDLVRLTNAIVAPIARLE